MVHLDFSTVSRVVFPIPPGIRVRLGTQTCPGRGLVVTTLLELVRVNDREGSPIFRSGCRNLGSDLVYSVGRWAVQDPLSRHLPVESPVPPSPPSLSRSLSFTATLSITLSCLDIPVCSEPYSSWNQDRGRTNDCPTRLLHPES